MLPFLKNNKEAAASSPVETIKRDRDEGKDIDGLELAAEDLCVAIEKKDYRAAAQALKAAFEIMELEPHEEGL